MCYFRSNSSESPPPVAGARIAPPTRAPQDRAGDGAVAGAALVIGARVFSMLISLVTIAVVARLLSPTDYGLVTMVLSATSFLSVFADLGLSYVTVQRSDITQQQLSALFWTNLAFGTLLGVITAVSAPMLAWFFRDSRLLAVTITLALVFPITGAGVQHRAILKRRMQFRILGLVTFSATVGGAIASIAMAASGAGYWALVGQSLATAAVGSSAAWFFLRWLPGPPGRCPDLRAMLGFGGRLTAHGVVGYLETNFDKLALGRYCGPVPLGLYATSYTLVARLVTLSAHAVGDAAIPALSRARNSVTDFRVTFRRMHQLTCLIGIAPCAFGILWTRDVLLTILGPQWESATMVLRLLLVGGLAWMLTVPTGWVYVAIGAPGKMLTWELLQAPLLAAAYIVGLEGGVRGVALAYALGHGFLLLPCWIYCLRRSPVTWLDVLLPIVRPLSCTIMACAVTSLIPICVCPQVAPGPARIVALLLVFTPLYVTTTIALVPLAREGFVVALRTMKTIATRRSSPPIMPGVLRD